LPRPTSNSRRSLIKRALALLAGSAWPTPRFAQAASLHARVRPGDAAWPTAAQWRGLERAVEGRLAVPSATLDPGANPLNPYFLSDNPGLTQNAGWFEAWRSSPSAYVVAAEKAADVVAAVHFARRHRLRLVVRGGGHSYQGTSCAPDSLLVWMRPMQDVRLHDAFVATGCADAPVPAVSVGAGALWMHVYDAVTTRGGRYVQDGGCATVGVAGLVQSGGFGSHSKHYGTAAGSLLEAEIVTADGRLRIVNRRRDPELFWALKGGGGGNYGVVTRLTLRTHELPTFFGVAMLRVAAQSDVAYRRLVARFVAFYRERLFNAHWGEQVAFDQHNVLTVSMVSHGLTRDELQSLWSPFLDAVRAEPDAYRLGEPLIAALPARDWWNAKFLKTLPGIVRVDDRPGAPEGNVFWEGNRDEPGQFLHAYRSAWLGAPALNADDGATLVDALFAASRHWRISLHFNKGLAGSPDEALALARETATNPGALDAFALAICAAEATDAYRQAPDLEVAAFERDRVYRAMDALLARVPSQGTYVSESDYFDPDWQRTCWGTNHARLAAAKRRYDPHGLFFVRHGVGSESWSDDGFTRRT